MYLGLIGIDALSISNLIMRKSCVKTKAMSKPFAAKMIYVGLLGQIVQFIRNHGLYPTSSVNMKTLAPDLHVGYMYLVEKKMAAKEEFGELCNYFTKSPSIASDIKSHHCRPGKFTANDNDASIIHWFLLCYHVYLENGPLASQKKKPVLDAGFITGPRSGSEVLEGLDNFCFKTPAGVESRCISAAQFILNDSLERLQSLQQIGALFFTTAINQLDHKTAIMSKLANAWKKKQSSENCGRPFMTVTVEGETKEPNSDMEDDDQAKGSEKEEEEDESEDDNEQRKTKRRKKKGIKTRAATQVPPKFSSLHERQCYDICGSIHNFFKNT